VTAKASPLLVLFVSASLPCHFAVAEAQDPGVVQLTSDATLAGTGLTVSLDDDDDDDDGIPDREQDSRVPTADLRRLRIEGRDPVTLRVSEGLRLIRDGRPVTTPLTIPSNALPVTIDLQGTIGSATARDRAVSVTRAGEETRIPVTVVALAFLNASNERIDPTREAVGPSHAITNDASLTRTGGFATTSSDPDDIRIEIRDPSASGLELDATLSSGAMGDRPRARRQLRLTRSGPNEPFRSAFVRLVGDVMDEEAPGVGDRVLRVALRDSVRVVYGTGDAEVSAGVRVGRAGREDGPLAARRGHLRVRILRHRRGGAVAVGDNEEGAIRIAREQVHIANEIWLQCFVDFGRPGDADIEVVDPPPPSLLSIADGAGLPAAGRGVIRFRANGRLVRVETHEGAPPISTALDVAAALRGQGLVAEVTENPPTEFGAGRSADLLVRDPQGNLARLTPDRQTPLSTDRRQSATIGVVDLTDGLLEFDNMTAAAGTLEERALIKALADDDPSTIDLFIINRFTAGTRQGEAFIESDGGAIVNTLILDRNGIRQQREAWTQSHEIGHILLDMPFHPDNVGPDRPWLLMDADSSQGLVTGPKRIPEEQCQRARARSGVSAIPVLLGRHTDESSTAPPARNAR
jgi:hypothetical protein